MIIGLLLLIFSLVLLMPLHINIVIKYESDKNMLIVEILLFNRLIRLKSSFFDRLLNKYISNINIGNEKIKKSLDNLNKSIKRLIKLNKSAKYLLRVTSIEKLNWKTKIGFKDAALTGFTVGIIWASKQSILSSPILNINRKKVSVDVIPKYNDYFLDVMFDCIIRFKIVYIIIAGLIVLRAKLKGGEAYVKSSNR